MTDGPTRVAIACQGGGSHTAFTAGVLDRLFGESDLFDGPDPDYELVGISGTSGGAMCAALSWYGLTHPEESPSDLLLDFWADLSARSPAERTANGWLQWATQAQRFGVPTTDVSPANTPGARWGQQELTRTLHRHIDFDRTAKLAAQTDLALLVSAIEVRSGKFEIFREDELTSPAPLLASAAEPNLFSAVPVGDGVYWDGLFSKNPPLEDFSATPDFPDPDEIWLIKINPQERLRVPRTADGIADRRNELAGNLSMNAEIRFIERINNWIEQDFLPDRYTHTDIERIRFRRPDLDWRTKLDRDSAFLDQLIEDGRHQAEGFLADR